MSVDAPSSANIGVLVTRPTVRADALCTLIQQHGARAIKFPVMEITVTTGDELSTAVREINAANLIIFVSIAAVHAVADELQHCNVTISPQVKVAVLGPKTAAACEAVGMRVDVVPHTVINSEGVLDALRDVDVAGSRVLIFRAQSGRELMMRELQSRGATVRYVESYRRVRTDQPLAPLLARWRRGEIHIVIIGSVEVWDALAEMFGADNRTLLTTTPVIAYSARIAEHIRAHGHHGDVFVAAQPTDEAAVTVMKTAFDVTKAK